MRVADKIFSGGNNLTMDPQQSTVEAITVTGNKITSIETLSQVEA